MRGVTANKSCRILLVSLSALAILAGCSGRKVTTSAGDHSLLQTEGGRTQSVPADLSAPSDPVRVTESIVTPSPASPGQLHPSQVVPATSLPALALGDIFFDYDRFALSNEARSTLEADARWFQGKHGMKVLIEGHCDERGTLAYNLILGERRAQSVKRYLQELGVPTSQIHITSYGKERPFCREHGEACWQQNRRAHFVAQ